MRQRLRATLQPQSSLLKKAMRQLLVGIVLMMWVVPASGQPTATAPAEPAADAETPSAPAEVDVKPLAEDVDIEDRLRRILEATGRFEDPQVQVQEGVVFLEGRTKKEEFRTWAGDLARKTQDVVAVVNRIEVVEGSLWDLSPAWAEIRRLVREAIQALPLLGLASLLLVVTWFASKLTVRVAEKVFERRMTNRLLRQVAARVLAIPVFLLGLYLVLRISGLTQMAATIIGGTGVAGLVFGIAYRDIAENFLASILISMQRPFALGDLIEVEGQQGYVQSVTTRGTLLMTLDGNHLQIPNATIYKAVIQNFTANPFARLTFSVGIGYDDSVTQAQETALAVLNDHPVVLDDPEPLVLVDSLGAATVNLQVYFWINGQEHSPLKTRSALIRLIKRAFEMADISMPDEAREIVFPNGVPIASTSEESPSKERRREVERSNVPAGDVHNGEAANTAEGDLSSEAAEINQQAEQSRRPDEATNLLE